MLAKRVFLYYCSVTVLVLNVTLVTSDDNEDEFRTQTTVVSLTGADTPFVYIEPICKSSNISTCNTFECSAFSGRETNIYWYFKPCVDEFCNYTYKESDFKKDGLQSSSNITLGSLDLGYLQCFANNSHANTSVLQQVVPINQGNRIFIQLEEKHFQYNILPNEDEIDVYWNIQYQGNPTPHFSLRANNTTIPPDSSLKYNWKWNNVDSKLYLKIKNVSEQDVSINFYLDANNEYENKTRQLSFNITDLKNVSIQVSYSNQTHAELECVATSVLPLNITWIFNRCPEKNCTPEIIPGENVKGTTPLQLTSYIKVNSSWSGILECTANNSMHLRSEVQKIESVKNGLDIFTTDDNIDIDKNSKRVKVGDSNYVKLTCGSSSHNHSAEVRWASSDLEKEINNSRLVSEIENTIFSNRRTLSLIGVRENKYGGIYFCKTWTKNNTLEYKQIEITYGDVREWTYYAIALLLLVLVVITAFIILKMRTYQKLQKEMKELNIVGLANFEKGALEHINPNLTIDDQAELLPYDKSYEFPIEKLKLGEQIGSGAFGVVVKAEAKGVFDEEPTTTVAVKMVNRNIGDVYIKALASELKIMIYLGKHVNVVNLLGACTQNITKRELLVIVEYCRFGNLKEYLLNHRHTFIDQINPETGQIDYSIGKDALGANDLEFPYITPSFASRIYKQQESSCNTINSLESDTQESTEPTKNLHYKGDYHNINRPVCTRDLLLWSFQIARGLEYLSSRKVLHGDLAARNILLTDGNVVKICDFGLSKKMYQKDIYKKSGDEMLPVKWMAVEAIVDKIFSVQSDVWSFGVVLWEIFSLARTPYPGIEYNETFLEKLLNGYRMKIPQFATQDIYDIMVDCWDADPTMRPSFSHLVDRIGAFINETFKEHYINMNNGYLKMNAQRFRGQIEGYLSMISAPDFRKYSSPYRYVNIVKPSPAEDITTYL